MRNLYSPLAAVTAAKQLKQTVGRASMCFTKTLLVIMFMITAASVKLFAQLPTLSYSTPQTYTVGTAVTLAPASSGVAGYGYSTSATTLASGFNVPMGVATDAAGNVYVADNGNKLVKKIPAGGGTPTTVGSGFTGPTGVAVDPSGNIWVIDSGDLKEVPAGGGAIITTSIGTAVALAVDSKGNVFVLESSEGYGGVIEYPVGGGPSIIVSTDDNLVDTGIAVDWLGNIFVSFLLPIPDGSQVEEVNGTGGYNNLGSGLNAPTCVAVDGIGNVFVADEMATGIIVEYPVNGAPQLTVSSGLNRPNGVALDGAGNIYESDAGTNTVKEIKAVGGYFISPGLPAGLNFDENTGIISGTPTVASPATNYTITAHNSSGSTFATLNIKVNPPPSPPTLSYSSPQTYTVGRAITPLTPTSSGVPAPTYGNPVTLVPGVYYTTDVAVDAAGNIYAGLTNFHEILKFPAGGGNGVVVASGFIGPLSIALDAAGNIYVADSPISGGIGNVYKVPAGGGTKVSIGSGFITPDGVAVDAAGNVYVADAGNNTVKKISLGGGAPVTIGSGFNRPVGIAVDATGNVYVADAGNNAVKEILASNGSTRTLGSGFNGPKGVATDAKGNVFVGDTGNGQVKEIPVAGGAPVVIGSEFTDPQGVTTDSSGDVYVVDFTSGNIKEIKLVGGYFVSALPQGLSIDRFTGVISGTPTVVSPATNYTVTAYNAGGGTPATVNIQVVANTVTLANLALSSGTLTPSFASGTINYTASVTNTVTSITVTPTTSSPTATVKVNSTTVASGSTSASIPLALGANAISVVVTAADGVSTNTYTVNVTRVPSANAGIANITLSTGTLSPAFATATTSYVDLVTYSTSSITLTPTASDPTATVRVNGAIVASGSASASISLTTGINPVTVIVTAQDGVTNTTYTVFVTRPSVALSYNSPNTYSIGTPIPLLAPTVSSGTVAAPGYSAPFSIGSGFNGPEYVAVDATGNVYVSTPGILQKISLDGGTTTISSGSNNGYGIATDVAGNVFTTGSTSGVITKIPAAGGTPVTVGSGFSYPIGVAVDAAGNVYVAELSGTQIKKIPVGGGAIQTIGSGVHGSSGVAVDAAGDVYAGVFNSSTSSFSVVEFPVGGGATITKASGLSNVSDLAVDAAGNVYVDVEAQSGMVMKIPASGGTPISIGSGFKYAPGIAVDANGTVYVADQENNAVKEIKLVGGYYINPALPAGLSFSSNTGVISGTPTAVSPATNYTVTAYNISGSGSATVNIKVANIGLSGLALSSGILSPTFATETTSYTANVSAVTTSITETPTSSTPSATITVNGITVASGTASASIPLSLGANTITTVVTAAGGTGTKTYTVKVGRGSADALLTSIKTSPVSTLTAVSGPGYKNYKTSVPNYETSLQITALTQDATATIKINGVITPSNVASQPIPLNVGNNVITTVVTAQDGTTTNSYIITVTRVSSNALLTSIKTSPVSTLTAVSGPGYKNYKTSVPNSQTSLQIIAVAEDATATIKINGVITPSNVASQPIPLKVGNNVITTVVTALDGTTTNSYIITVTRESSNALLTSIKTSPVSTLTAVSGPGYKNYKTSVPNSEASLQIIAVAEDATATIKINGAITPSNVASQPIPLKVGNNVITTVVTALDGTTTNSYIITVTRISSNALLTSIKTSPVSTLTAVSGPGYKNYKTSVPNSQTSLQIIAVAEDATATIKINGVITPSNVASQPIPLNVGNNVITTVVTALDGTTTNSYIITVTRETGVMGDLFQTASVTKPTNNPIIENDGLVVHQGVSPNGDGIDDVFTIEGLTAYPQNKVSILDRNGAVIFQAKGYDNQLTGFDGHSNINGRMQLPGTYFYTLDYTVNGENKHKTGYIILKY